MRLQRTSDLSSLFFLRSVHRAMKQVANRVYSEQDNVAKINHWGEHAQ